MIQLFSKVKGMCRTSNRIGTGIAAPALIVKDHSSGAVNLANVYKGQVLFFYFMQGLSSTNNEITGSLKDAYSKIRARNVFVAGISVEEPQALSRFRDSMGIPFMFLSDPSAELIKGFKVPTKFGFPASQGFLIQDGTIVWNSRKDLDGSTGEVLLGVLDDLGISGL